jgi:hypothetical protein
MLQPANQIAIGNKFGLARTSESNKDDSLELSHKVYFTHAVTTSQASRRCRSMFVRCADEEEVSAAAMDSLL